MSEGKLPANIRQIGTIDESGISVYIEDFVCTYLRQLAESGGKCETLAYLIGKTYSVDGRDCVFISGAVAGKHSKYIDGMESFTEKSDKYAEDMLKLYFPGYEVVGWMQSQPGYGCAVNPAYADCHMDRFTKPYQVLFVTDPIERLNAFYSWDADMSGISERGGYIIYYDKNDGMREYMLDNKLPPKRGSAKQSGEDRHSKEASKTPAGTSSLGGAPGRGIFGGAGKKEGGEYRKVVNMLVSLSAVLFIICFIMGAGLIQADSRVTKLENEVAALDATYGFLVAQTKNAAAQDVFAAGGNNAPDIVFNDDTAGEAPEANAAAYDDTAPLNNNDAIAALNNNAAVTERTGVEAADTALAAKSPKPAEPPAVSPPPPPSPSPSPVIQSEAARQSQSEDPNAVTQSRAEYETYIVEQGDSLLSISWKFYGGPEKVREIMELNNIAEADVIYYGKKLKLPPK